MLPDFRGVYDFREVWAQFVCYGFTTDTALYPLGIPLFSEYPAIHLEACLAMVHGASKQNWKRYELLDTDFKFLEIGVFNVL